MDILELDKRIKNKFGDGHSVVKILEDETRCIVSDGVYEYVVTTRKQIDSKLTKQSLTDESFIKRLNTFCSNGISIIGLTNRGGGNTTKIIMTHNETGYTTTRIYEKKKLKNICKQIEKEATINGIIKQKSILKFGDKFLFDKFIYTKCDDLSIITCMIHGDFEIEPNNFIQSKYGCPQCGLEKKAVFSRSGFDKNCMDGIGYIYLIECENENERFLKIGITSNIDLKRRFSRSEHMPYKYKKVLMVGSNPNDVFDMEQKCHRLFKQNRHKPNIYFKGETECFDISIKPQAISLIEELLVSLPQE